MDGIAAPPANRGGGEGSSPLLDLAGFNGRLERLLALARAHQNAADREAAQLRRGLVKLGAVQAAARWLDQPLQLGRDVFARGRAELIGTATLHQVDVIEFLWASLMLFDDDLPSPDTTASYRPVWLDLRSIPHARGRILRRMADHQNPCPLDQLLPDLPGSGAALESGLRGRLRWTSTFVAGLELAKQGEVVLKQDQTFSPIQVSGAVEDKVMVLGYNGPP